MTRKPTPNDILAPVSRETPDDVALAIGARDLPGAGRTPQLVAVAFVQDNPYQPRQTYNGIEELAENIRLNGLLQAPVARPYAGSYQLAFGHRRLRAYRLLAQQHGGDWLQIPLVVMDLTDEQMAKHAWSENHNREDVSAVEEARLFARMIADFAVTQQQIADQVGKSRSAVANTLRLLQLPEAAQAMIDAGQLTERHGRELLRLAGAPAWLDNFIGDLTGKVKNDATPTVSWLRRAISDHIVRSGTPLPDTRIKMATYYDDKEVDPPPWPADYAPKSPDVRGVCAGCAWLVTFDREPAARCTDGKCYQAKDRLWTEHDRDRQRQAALAAINAAPVATPRPDIAVAELAPRVVDGIARMTSGTNGFYSGSSIAPPALLDHGLCGRDQCDCFCLARLDQYDLSRRNEFRRPDPDNAPDIVYACSDGRRLASRRNVLEGIEEPAKAAERNAASAAKAAETREARKLLNETWDSLGAEGMATHQPFMAQIAKSLVTGYSYGGDDAKYRAMTIDQLWEAVFWWIADKLCRQTIWDNTGKRTEHWDLAKVTGLRSGLNRPDHQPGPGDSQQTNWQDGWDDDDEQFWQNLVGMQEAMFKPHIVAVIDRPRVLLRMIEQADKPTRAALWQRHNQLVSQET